MITSLCKRKAEGDRGRFDYRDRRQCEDSNSHLVTMQVAKQHAKVADQKDEKNQDFL